jgi:hypothetical protein
MDTYCGIVTATQDFAGKLEDFWFDTTLALEFSSFQVQVSYSTAKQMFYVRKNKTSINRSKYVK